MPLLEQASSISAGVDRLFLWFFGASVAALFLITATIVWFVVRYRRDRNPEPVDIEGSVPLEIAWTVIPLVLFLVMFYFGWTQYGVSRNPPPDAMIVEVIGRQWAWDFKYPSGRRTQELTVALGRPVLLEMNSADVLHGFYIPAFRLKMDVIPGTTTRIWFTPLLLGSFDIQCTVICGVNHTYMLSKVHVVPEEEFRAWYFAPDDALAGSASPAPAAGSAAPAAPDPPGIALLRRHDCLTCHSVDGRTGVGPTFLGMAGSVQEFTIEGKDETRAVDRALILRGMREPAWARMKGYPPVMPTARADGPTMEAMADAILALSAPAAAPSPASPPAPEGASKAAPAPAPGPGPGPVPAAE